MGRVRAWLAVSMLALSGCASSPASGTAEVSTPRVAVAAAPVRATEADVIAERSLADLASAIREGRLSSEQVVSAYLDRISRIDSAGPEINAILALNPDALAQARALDRERADGKIRGRLHGVPVLLKDTIESRDRIATTAGSLALRDNITHRDSTIAARLRAQGAVILGKTNLSEWSDFRHPNAIGGWSGVGGLTKNPYALDRTPCGSSSGSAAATASALAAAGIGVETVGSISCPASMTGVVGFKPSVGLAPMDGVIVFSPTQDSAGPIARTVEDAALVLSAMADKDFTTALDKRALRGKRIGVLMEGNSEEVFELYRHARDQLREAGAELVPVETVPALDGLAQADLTLMIHELKTSLDGYLRKTGPEVEVKSIRDVAEFNKINAGVEMPFFEQDMLIVAAGAEGMKSDEYRQAKADAMRLSRTEGLDAMMDGAKVDILVAPTQGPAFIVDEVLGDRFVNDRTGSSGMLAAVAGYPHLTVPMGDVSGLPVGLSFIGRAGADADVLAAGYAYEQESKARRPPTFPPTVSRAAVRPGR